MEQILALVSDDDDKTDEEDRGELDLHSVEGSESNLANAEDVERDVRQGNFEDVVRDVLLDDVENACPGPPEMRVQHERRGGVSGTGSAHRTRKWTAMQVSA
ncbi:unnamed protein product [Heligmosomoides polygyrus]|uniref:Uncharacterized protein n=1 Tax=Heligmosomoides polygyrus TaxID=6339 RepID=A0A183FJN7_HELPZ|nr:unnamed protein product [Heligmosomoides polygyrus]